jgi:uncharacterized protein (TIGR02421 family)
VKQSKQLDEVVQLDRLIVRAAAPIKVLGRLAWPNHLEDDFLKHYQAGNPQLPQVTLDRPDHARDIERLESLMALCDRGHPVGNFLFRTARSFAMAARMIQGMGTYEFTKQSISLYGRPDARYRTQSVTVLDAADQFLSTTDKLLGSYKIPPVCPSIPTDDFACRLRKRVIAFFEHDRVEVVLDPDLPSKATAGSQRIRLREGIYFSELDLDQLLHHEAYVHSATVLNGKRQKNLKCLGLGSPRTTRTQEGLATLAELATLSIDINRLRRLALRVRAVKLALDGADFIEVFRLFLEAGQAEQESYKSTQRIFRGGDVRGRIVLTKDAAYLGGLLEVHTFLRKAIQVNRPELIHNLFAGRLTLGDTVDLSEYFETGFLKGPTYVPYWASDLRRIAAMLAFSAFVGRIALDQVSLSDFAAHEDHSLDPLLDDDGA